MVDGAYGKVGLVHAERPFDEGCPVIVSALHRLAAEDPDFHMMDASDLSVQRDNLHFDARGAEELGRRVCEQLATD